MSAHEKGQGSTTRPASSKSHRSSSDNTNHTTSRLARKYPRAISIIRTEMARWPEGSKVHNWLAGMLEG